MKHTGTSHAEKIFFSALVHSRGEVSAFVLHRKFRLLPGEISRIVKKYEESQVISLDGLSIKLTDTGKKWILKEGGKLNLALDKKWRECPEDLKQTKLDHREFYIPIISKLDKQLLKTQEDKV